MRKAIACLPLIFVTSMAAANGPFSVSGYANQEKYRQANAGLGQPAVGEKRVVFMGDSITEFWPVHNPDFFARHGYIGRGISGQVSHQMLLRFRDDVIALKPKVVVILAGTNDLAQNSGPVSLDATAGNIYSMAELAQLHGARVILCSVLPAIAFPWRQGIEPAQNILALNRKLKQYAAEHQLAYVDFYSALVDGHGGLKVPDYTSAKDLVHPNKAGYQVMEALITPAIQQALQASD
ncbi:SGNH/GDSL hydrolase family protein [Rheinheimera sp.]|uniref:SGNH/GDSL hydrolase family protein n=1 Tax=Rheinheimera sp. TaxID=1869214 RepID=UPI00307CEC20